MTDTTETDRYDAMRAELTTAKAMRPGEPRNDLVRLTTAHALVDIAESLSTMSLESLLAMQSAGVLERQPDEGVDGGPERTGEPDPDDPETWPLDIDDQVMLKAALAEVPTLENGQPAEGAEVSVGVITALGVTEGTDYALVEWPDGTSNKVWLADLVRVLDAIVTPAGESEVDIEPDTEPDPRDLVDELDADFEGDRHPGAASGLAALKALEGKGGKSGKAKNKGKG